MRLIDRMLSRQGYNEAMYSGAILVATDDPGGRGKEPPPAGFAAQVRHIYASDGPVFAACFARMSLFSEARFKFQQAKDDSLYGNPDLHLLEYPWPNGTSGDLLARMEQDRQHRGELLRPQGRPAGRQRPSWCGCGPDAVTIISEEVTDDLGRVHKRPVGYSEDMSVYGMQGRDPQVYDVDEVAHWAPDPDPYANWRGMSWMTPVIREIVSDKGMTEYKIAHIHNGAMPGIVLKYSPEAVAADGG